MLAGAVSTPDGTISRPRRSLAVLTPATRDAWVDRTEGRKVFTVGTISAGDVVTARADGVFIRVEAPVPAD